VLWHFIDRDERYLMELSNGVLLHYPTRHTPQADLAVTLTHPQLPALLGTGSLEGIQTSGDRSVPGTLMSLTDEPDPDFAIVRP
jgi:alkyl sulfatase BDS1-like metallo-beta-lactamase superfamily hydrolase